MDKEFFEYITSEEGKSKLKKEDEELKKFCAENNITRIQNEFYFDLFNVHFMVSRNSVKVSNAKSVKEKLLQSSDPDVDRSEIIHIKGNKQTIMQIYTDLKNGVELDFNGNRIVQEPKPVQRTKPILKPKTEQPKVEQSKVETPIIPKPTVIKPVNRQSVREQALNSLFKKR